MTVELLAPLDPTGMAGPTELDVPGTGLLVIPALPPDPTPGDPTVLWDPPAPTVLGREVAVIICESATHRKLADVESATVASWDDPLTVEAVGKASLLVSLHDPCWEVLGAPWSTNGDTLVVDPDWRRYEVSILEDNELVFSGYLDDPVTIAGNEVSLDVSGAAVALDRTVGDTGTSDALGGAGSFQTASGDAETWLRAHGWSINDQLQVEGQMLEARWNVIDPFSGTRGLQVRGIGVLRGPVIPVSQYSTFLRTRATSAMVRHTESYVVAETEVYADGATQVNAEQSQAQAAASQEDDDGWQEVAPVGTLRRGSGVDFIRLALRIYSIDGWVDVDEVRYPLDGFTGSRTKIDRAKYPKLIMDRLESTSNPDGQSLGITVQVDGLTGSLVQLSWPDEDDVRAIDMIHEVNDFFALGADVWIDPAWRMRVAPRRGSNRLDLLLDNDVVLQPGFESDPGAIVDQLRVLTPWGSGATRRAFAYDTPRLPGTRINRQVTQGPTAYTWEQLNIWGIYTAKNLGRDQRYADLVVSDAFAGLVVTGDGIQVALTAGHVGWWGWVRVANRRFRPGTGTAVLTVGLDPEVTG